jgi:hypothetical protein
MLLSRRGLVVSSSAFVASSFAPALAQAGQPYDEEQRGDLDAPVETVRVDPRAISELSDPDRRAVFNPRDADFPATLVSVASEFLGFDRVENEDEITEFLALFDLPFKDAKTEKYIPYCAAGLTYAASLAYRRFWKGKQASASVVTLRESMPELDRYHFFPTPSVRSMYHVAVGKSRWLEATNVKKRPSPKPGYVVIYSFATKPATAAPNHCGIIESVEDGFLNTIEFNTTNGLEGDQRNGGMVTRRRRAYNKYVRGFISTDARN